MLEVMVENREIKKHFIQLNIDHDDDKYLHSLIYMAIYRQKRKLELDQSKYRTWINFILVSVT